MRQIVLASSSPFRKELLQRLQLEFEATSPNIDETVQTDEPSPDLVMRLAVSKAYAVAVKYPNAIIIGSDQVAVCEEQILGKPGNIENATEQLKFVSGKLVTFYTGLCVLDANNKELQRDYVKFFVEFRQLTDEMIANYLTKEPAFNCAGSFKSEALGVALTLRMSGKDPTALVGLPLIRLTQMLEKAGIKII